LTVSWAHNALLTVKS